MENLLNPSLGLIFWTAITFLTVLFILSRTAFKPISKALAEREQSIQTALDAADKAREEMKLLQASNEKLLQEARSEREEMLKEARSAAVKTVEEAQEKANSEYTRIVESAQQEITREKEAALAEVRKQVADLSVQIAEKVVRKQLGSEAAQKDLVEGYLKELNVN